LKTVRNACVSNAEAATIVAEVLWGSSPWYCVINKFGLAGNWKGNCLWSGLVIC
jgi:hypothetical protein